MTILLLLACRPESGAALLARALEAANAGDPAAWSLCDQLGPGDDGASCKMIAVRALPVEERAAACDRIVLAQWQGECWFEIAETCAAQQRWDEAIAACRNAEPFGVDCARHLWLASALEGPPAPAVLARLRSAFPLQHSGVDGGEGSTPAVAADIDAGREAGRAHHADERAGQAAGIDVRWEEHFRASRVILTADCPVAERAGCVAAAVEVYTERWSRAATRSAEATGGLCGTRQGLDRLGTSAEPELIAAEAGLRAKYCP